MSNYNLSEINYFAVNIMDLTQLSPIELLIVQDKIESHSIITISNNKIDGQAVLLRSNLPTDQSLDFSTKQKRQLFATCQLLAEYNQVRTYYSKNGRSFHPFKFNGRDAYHG